MRKRHAQKRRKHHQSKQLKLLIPKIGQIARCANGQKRLNSIGPVFITFVLSFGTLMEICSRNFIVYIRLSQNSLLQRQILKWSTRLRKLNFSERLENCFTNKCKFKKLLFLNKTSCYYVPKHSTAPSVPLMSSRVLRSFYSIQFHFQLF